MEFKSLKNIETGFRQIRFFGIAYLFALSFKNANAPETFSGVSIFGNSAFANKIAADKGMDINASARKFQYLSPTNSKNSVLTRITPTTPQAYTECNLLISWSGFSAGIAAIVGLIKTSANPLDAEKITVPNSNPQYAICGKHKGKSANANKPMTVNTGVHFTVAAILNLCEKKEKIKSTVNCVKKLTSTNAPKSEYEIPYALRNVINNNGERLLTTAIEMFVI